MFKNIKQDTIFMETMYCLEAAGIKLVLYLKVMIKLNSSMLIKSLVNINCLYFIRLITNFGLINRVSNYIKLQKVREPFKNRLFHNKTRVALIGKDEV